jgi:UDP-N-acetylglucosamine pyrophosphorylase
MASSVSSLPLGSYGAGSYGAMTSIPRATYGPSIYGSTYGGHGTTYGAPTTYAPTTYAAPTTTYAAPTTTCCVSDRAYSAADDFMESESFVTKFQPIEDLMKAEGLGPAAIQAFKYSYSRLVSGDKGMILESDIAPAKDVAKLEDIQKSIKQDTTLLKKTAVVKLNGGLGTGMGLDKAKSLLPVKDGDSFLDLIAKQVVDMRQKYGGVKFMLMNSFSTSADTIAALKPYPDLANDKNIEFVQNKVPKIAKDDLTAAKCPSATDNEWCPPGHGDIYAALIGSGRLKALLDDGIEYVCVSNSDNLGATLDLDLLTYFAQDGAPFMMEVCRRTENDKKGGHLAVRSKDKQLILRESAQCADDDEKDFQNIDKHQYFNTNNLWLRLSSLQKLIDDSGGAIKLPVILNAKTVDPKDDSSTAVWQLETAMGAAIECFQGAKAVEVPRTRFAPVKKCSDLFLLRSDAYVIDGFKPVLAAGVDAAPTIDLDSKKYKMVPQLDKCTPSGVPSLKQCKKLTVKGEVVFSPGTTFVGEVTVKNTSKDPVTLPKGTYKDTSIELPA